MSTNVDQALELIRCAQINLDNLAKASPHAANTPYFKIVQVQLTEAEKALEGS